MKDNRFYAKNIINVLFSLNWIENSRDLEQRTVIYRTFVLVQWPSTRTLLKFTFSSVIIAREMKRMNSKYLLITIKFVLIEKKKLKTKNIKQYKT